MKINNKEKRAEIGKGIYTVVDISKILNIPYGKVNLWLNKYWDGEIGREFESQYSWSIGSSKAVNFYTLVEFYVFYLFGEAGVSTRSVLNARKELGKIYKTNYPFAQRSIIESIRTDNKSIYLKNGEDIITLDVTRQLNLNFIELFFMKLEFDKEMLACRFWPMGKENSILVDPERQFGHPILDKTNIYPETIYSLYKGGEEIEFISYIYEIDIKKVKDAIKYCEVA